MVNATHKLVAFKRMIPIGAIYVRPDDPDHLDHMVESYALMTGAERVVVEPQQGARNG